MVFHPCTCSYVPPHVIEALARRGDARTRVSARNTAQQSKITRDLRGARPVKMSAILASARAAGAAGVMAPPTGTAGRAVYDSQHQWVQRVKLVRGEGDPATGDTDTDVVYELAGAVRQYYKDQLNRDSIDNLKMNLILNVHFGTAYMNAFWDGDEMTFGDGDGTIFTSFARSLDVVAHELAHGVTQFTANLDYYSQSGALNEHFSDVIGSAVTQFVEKQDAGTADWLIGNEIMGPTLFGESLRSMRSPGTAYDNTLIGQDPQPAHMSNYYAGPADNQGVHINSGIPNRAFYLVAFTIGTLKATRLWYHALQNLWSTAAFADAVDVIVESARVLTKTGEVPLGTTQAVRLAFREVGL
jgi:Zn-dependent metalloprotease